MITIKHICLWLETSVRSLALSGSVMIILTHFNTIDDSNSNFFLLKEW